MATRGSYVISLWENSRGHPDNDSYMQFSTKIDGFEQKYSQGFGNSYNSHEQYPLEKFFIFTIYQNYTLALTLISPGYFGGWVARVGGGLRSRPWIARSARKFDKGRVRCKLQDCIVRLFFSIIFNFI